MKFQIEFTSRAAKDLKNFSLNIQKYILEESLQLESDPFKLKNRIK